MDQPSVDVPLLTTLGLFIIDENQYAPSAGREPEYNIIGGGASYAIVGGRVAAGAKLGKQICGIIDKGTDFPVEIEQEISSWGSGAIFRPNHQRLTSRGANIYGADGVRTFVYRTPKKRIVAQDILDTANLIESRSFHFCCSIERCEETIDIFREARARSGKQLANAKYIFEPFPEICVAENIDSLHAMLHKVDVFTPNLNEAADFYSMDALPQSAASIEALASKFLASAPVHGGVVLRCGALGCFVKTRDVSIMLPAYHQDQKHVVDVTGGGNLSWCIHHSSRTLW
ncbi:hypothetical protein JCM33374_g2477 [Metschnikowia sp. JCM 33374]|nr:hypothetical protein JCM33374_g2477 [Metschnikowia sp. JCM 33374]